MGNYLFIARKNGPNSKLALIAFFLAFVVISLGAFTRLTNAGLSCPDWPHCYGYLTAPHTQAQVQAATQLYPNTPVDIKKAWTEMTHRYFAGSEAILILILSFSLLFNRKAKSTKTLFIGVSLLVLLSLQILLGMLTVTEKLKPVIVLSHLLTGISILSMLWWAFLDLHHWEENYTARHAWVSLACWLGFFVVIAQITLGGWVSTHYAGLACVDLPYCNGQLLPTLHFDQLNSDLITIHMLHRIGALITAIYISMLAAFLLTQRSFRFIGAILLTLLVLQISLGILNVIWLRPVWIALLHQMVAIFILLTMISSLVKAHPSLENRYGF